MLEEFVGVSDPARAAANRRLLDEFIPDKVPVDLLQGVLRRLLDEKVSVRNLPLILEGVTDAKRVTSSEDVITEHVRTRIGFQLVAENAEADGALPMIQLAPEWEQLFTEHQIEDESGVVDIALPPSDFNRLAGAIADKVADAAAKGRHPVIATTGRRRRFLRTVLSAKGVRNAVLSFDEIGTNAKPALLGVA